MTGRRGEGLMSDTTPNPNSPCMPYDQYTQSQLVRPLLSYSRSNDSQYNTIISDLHIFFMLYDFQCNVIDVFF